MFAPRYAVPVGDLLIEMGPPKSRVEVAEFAELMSSPKVTRYLGRVAGYTPEDEADWYDHTREDKGACIWLLFDITGGKRVLIGNTGFHDSGLPLKTVVTGCQISRPEYWGKGIAKATHQVRTWHAFARTGIVCLRSCVFAPNVGSQKALESVGYVVVSTERNQALDDGQLVSKINLECVNPDRYIWSQWWHGDRVPKAFREARTKTQAALDWVRETVKPFEV